MRTWGLPWWLSGKESACQCRRCRFDPCVRKIPWSRKWLPTPVFLPGKSHEQRSLVGYSSWDHESVRHDWATFTRDITYLLIFDYCFSYVSVAQPYLDSLWPHGQQPTRLLCSWDFLGKNTAAGCHFLLRGIFRTQRLNRISCISCISRWVLDHWATKEANFFTWIFIFPLTHGSFSLGGLSITS